MVSIQLLVLRGYGDLLLQLLPKLLTNAHWGGEGGLERTKEKFSISEVVFHWGAETGLS